MDIEALTYLRSGEGERLLAAIADLPGDSIAKQTVLRKDYPGERVRLALTLADLRSHAAGKFEHAGRMFFDRDGLEQASGDVIAAHRARRFASYDRVADLCSGVGGDSADLARVSDLTSVDIRPGRAAMTDANVEAAGYRTKAVCADVRHWRPTADAIFLDPSRRESGRRVTKLSNYAPSVDDLTWLGKFSAIGIKVAPGISHKTVPDACEVEFISVNGECREAVLWMGSIRSDAAVRATLLPGGESLIGEAVEPVGCRGVSEYVYEPDRAVIRAHLIEQLAVRIGCEKLDPDVAYLTSDHLDPTPFATAYRVLETMPFSMKGLQSYVSDKRIGVLEIKKRRFPMTPDEVRKKLKLKGDQKETVILTRVGGKATVVVCEREAAR